MEVFVVKNFLDHLTTSSNVQLDKVTEVYKTPQKVNELKISEIINKAVVEAKTKVAPLWDTRDYVAVNPLFGYRDSDFLETVKKVFSLTGVVLLPEKKFLKKKFISGEIEVKDLQETLELLQSNDKSGEFKDISLESLLAFLDSDSLSAATVTSATSATPVATTAPANANATSTAAPVATVTNFNTHTKTHSGSGFQNLTDLNRLRIKCLSDQYDLDYGTNETETITKEISKWAAAYFDEGQSLWEMPNKNQRFFKAWRSLVEFDDSSSVSVREIKKLVKTLPSDPYKAISFMSTKILESQMWDEERLSDYFLRLLLTVQGWSSFVQKIDFEKDLLKEQGPAQQKTELVDVLAVRLAYDFIFLKEEVKLKKIATWNKSYFYSNNPLNLNYVWLCAHENSVRRDTLEKLNINGSQSKKLSAKGRKLKHENRRPLLAQMAFCIDVRSEVMRRHLENRSENIETIGFAGFFGLPVSIKKTGFVKGDSQCPVLIKPVLEVEESGGSNVDTYEGLEAEQGGDLNSANASEKIRSTNEKIISSGEKIKKKAFWSLGHQNVKSSSNSSFAIAETFGFSYAFKMFKNAFSLSKPNLDFDFGLKDNHLNTSKISVEIKTEMALNALTNMGLTDNFAKYVFFFGHGGESSNNPYHSALDCGACAGHNGKNNGRLLADFLNDPNVRNQLKLKGVEVPQETLFLSGWHNTTKDLLIVESIEKSIHCKEDLDELNKLIKDAQLDCKKERAQDFFIKVNIPSDKALKKETDHRAQDWSEVRPEWGLARNHSFIVARRQFTRSVDLEGRSFLHDYDEASDPDLKKLELIMTAPMIVTNWINMQYYASTIDTDKFGAGNKAINNVVGNIGCIQGNESDLLGGLTEQSVRFEGEYFHEPLRLQVFIEASPSSIDQIINKHQMVSDLVSNGWVSIISIDIENNEYKLRHREKWLHLKKSEMVWN